MLFFKECKAIFKSIIFFTFLAVVVIFYVTQLGDYSGKDIEQYTDRQDTTSELLSDNPLIAPVPGLDHYGYKNAEIPRQVMPNAIACLVQEVRANSFAAYPMGIYRDIKLSTKQIAEIERMLTQMTGLTMAELYDRYEETTQGEVDKVMKSNQQIDYSNAIPVSADYDSFKQKMVYIDDLIGGGSSYKSENLKSFGSIPINYEEKLAEYNTIINEDKITGAYARLFCDYMGIVIALFSIFVPVSSLLRDKRAKMNELIFSRNSSSARIILIRYFALIVMMILPFLILSGIPAVQLILFGIKEGFAVDYFAFIKYISAWLLPTLMAVTAVGCCFTVLTNTPIAILVQFLWSFLGILAGADSLEGGRYGYEIAIRHNALGNLHLVKDNMDALVFNRISYCILSLMLVLLTIGIYQLKRRGKLNVFNGMRKKRSISKVSNKTGSAV